MRQELSLGLTSAASASEGADDTALVLAAKERSGDAWSEIYERYYPPVFKYMLARVAVRETAEDLAASVFVEAVRKIGSYRERGRPLLAWLYGIARNLANHHHRTAMRRAEIAPLASLQDEGPLDDAPAGDAERLVESWDLQQALSRLSTAQREAVLLRYVVGLTTPQVAAVMGKKERAVYSLNARALQSLRRHLGDDFLSQIPRAAE